MKNIKYKAVMAATLLSVFTLGGCKRTPRPVGKSVYATVYGIAESWDSPAQEVFLNLNDKESLNLHSDTTKYHIGDTVWFYYDETAKKFGRVDPFNVMSEPKPEFKAFVRKQQKEIYENKR